MTDIVGGGMSDNEPITDNLRSESNENQKPLDFDLCTRIAAVLDHHYPVTTHADGTPDHLCCCGLPRQHVANAVIAELGLEPETRIGLLSGYIRYATGWRVDE